MQRFNFKKGLSFLENQKQWTIVRRLVTGKLQLEDDQGEIITLTDQEILQKWQERVWLIDESTINSFSDVLYLATPRDLSTFPEKHQRIAKRRLQYIQGIDPEVNPYNVEKWKNLIDQVALEINDPNPPCPSSIWKWFSRYKHGKSILSLIPQRSKRVNSSKKLGYSIFEEVIASIYLSNQKKPKIEVVEAVQNHIRKLNLGLAPEDQHQTISRSTVYRWLSELQQDLVDASRMGASAARMKYRTAMGGLKVDEILERVEIDHTPTDLLVIDGDTKLPLGRPWLTKAIDKRSRMIMGFYFSFSGPSTHAVLQCLKTAIMPKEQWLERFPEVKGKWPASGIPDLVAVDNGMELHSQGVKEACLELGVQTLFCPAGDPYTKANVERFFKTINDGLFHQLPGTVFSNITERGDYPAETEAAIDLETLIKVFLIWIVDVYQVSFHRGIGTSPLLKWMQEMDKRLFHWPVNPDSLAIITGIPAERTLFHYGIEFDRLHYNSIQLQQIRRQAGKNLLVQLKFYEDTVDFIHVYDPYTKEYIQVDVIDSVYASSLPRHSHRLICAHARKLFGDQFSPAQKMEAKELIQEEISKAIKNKKMGLRKKSAKNVMHDSDAVLNKVDALSKARNPKLKAPIKPADLLPDGLSDQLPHISRMGLPSLNLDEEDEKPRSTKP